MFEHAWQAWVVVLLQGCRKTTFWESPTWCFHSCCCLLAFAVLFLFHGENIWKYFNLRFCDIAKEFAFIYSSPLLAFTKTERGMCVQRRARVPPHFPSPALWSWANWLSEVRYVNPSSGDNCILSGFLVLKKSKRKCKCLVFLSWMTYAEFLQACLENTLLTTQEYLSGWVFQGTNPLLTKKPKRNMVLQVSCAG